MPVKRKSSVRVKKPSQFEAPVTDASMNHNYDNKSQNLSRFFSKQFSRLTSNFSLKVLIVLFLVAVGVAGYTYKLYKDSQDQVKKLKNPTEVSKSEVQQLEAAVGKLISLPKETPTVATVVDIKKLKNQPFFAKASNGDKVLIFPQAKKAILYNPKSNKIIEVAPINIGQNKESDVAGESTKSNSAVAKPSPTSKPTSKSKPSPTSKPTPTEDVTPTLEQ